MELNSFVRWDARTAYLEIGGAGRRARGVLRRARADPRRLHRRPARARGRSRSRSTRIAGDSARTTSRTGSCAARARRFTVAELVDAESRSASIRFLALRAQGDRPARAPRAARIVEQVRGRVADQTYYGDVSTAQDAVYRLARDVSVKLAAFARLSERERADLGAVERARAAVGGLRRRRRRRRRPLRARRGDRPWRTRPRLPRPRPAGHRDVAVKLFDGSAMDDDDLMRARFTANPNRPSVRTRTSSAPTTRSQTRTAGSASHGFVDGTSLEQLLAPAR